MAVPAFVRMLTLKPARSRTSTTALKEKVISRISVVISINLYVSHLKVLHFKKIHEHIRDLNVSRNFIQIDKLFDDGGLILLSLAMQAIFRISFI